VANCYTAIEQGVEVVPVLNKIDLPSADPEGAIREIEDVIGIDAKDALRRQRQDRRGRAGHTRGSHRAHPGAQGAIGRRRSKALIIDSWFDNMSAW